MIDKVWTEPHFRRGAKRGWAPQVDSTSAVGSCRVRLGATGPMTPVAESLFGGIDPGALRSL